MTDYFGLLVGAVVGLGAFVATVLNVRRKANRERLK